MSDETKPTRVAEGAYEVVVPDPPPKRRQGFALLTTAQRKAVASAGGKASHALGRGHTWSSEEARAAGRIGGRTARGGRGKAGPT